MSVFFNVHGCKTAAAILDTIINFTVTANLRKGCLPGNCCWGFYSKPISDDPYCPLGITGKLRESNLVELRNDITK